MQRFKYEDNELIPILQAGDLITVNDSLVEIADSGCACFGCYFKAFSCIMECRCPLDGDLIFRKVEKKIKQDERVEQTKSMAEEEGIYFY
jgi:hypothetical protein